MKIFVASSTDTPGFGRQNSGNDPPNPIITACISRIPSIYRLQLSRPASGISLGCFPWHSNSNWSVRSADEEKAMADSKQQENAMKVSLRNGPAKKRLKA